MAKLKKETVEMMKKVSQIKKPEMPKIDISSTEVVKPKYELAAEPKAIPIGKGKLNLEDTRKVRATTQKALNPNTDLVSGQYDKGTIQQVLDAAKRYNYDPYTALAVALQESRLGQSDDNLGHLLDNPTAISSKLPDRKKARQSMKREEFDKMYSADDMVRMLMEKKDMADKLGMKDEFHHLQAYNGLGKVYPKTENDYHGYDMAKIYGVDLPKEGIDMKKNPLYGKQVIDLRENVIKKNPEIMKIAKTYYNPNAPKQHSKEELMKILKSMKRG